MKEPARRPAPASARGQALEPEGPPGSTGLSGPKVDAPFDAVRKLRELEFLHEFAKLLTTARNWDELMGTIVDRTTTALDVEVCSVYLKERDESCLRLAATNGLDRDQIGRVTLGLAKA